MKLEKSSKRSRQETPWDLCNDLTPTQEFLKTHYKVHYDLRHPHLKDTGESAVINSYVPPKCPCCGSETFKKNGLTANGVQRYKCLCGQSFTPTTGTIFDDHKISISEWMEYCLNLFRQVSINADSWNNKNAYTTSQYWLKKVFITLEGWQKNIQLSGNVYLDETYYSYVSGDPRNFTEKGRSRANKLCIGVAMDDTHMVCLLEGDGKTSFKKTIDAFGDIIVPGSKLIHDGEYSHSKLIELLNLQSEVHPNKETKGLPDNKNPLNPINQMHNRLKRFLNSHSGFNRDDIQGYLDLFAFVHNPPSDPLEKVELLLKTAFSNPKKLRYRDVFASK